MKAALVGNNISYSYSKIIHNYISAKYHLNYQYDIIEVDLLDMEHFKQYLFLNITTPFKESILSLVNETLEVKKIKSANLVIKDNKEWWAYNTDYQGFLDLLILNDIDYQQKKIFILGNGGAARAVYYALKKENVTVVVRNNTSHQLFGKVIYYDQLINENPDIIINTTLHQAKLSCTLFNEKTLHNSILIDLNYYQSPTYLMKYFNNCYDGLDMLLSQAFLAAQIAFKDDKIKYEAEDKKNIMRLL